MSDITYERALEVISEYRSKYPYEICSENAYAIWALDEIASAITEQRDLQDGYFGRWERTPISIISSFMAQLDSCASVEGPRQRDFIAAFNAADELKYYILTVED